MGFYQHPAAIVESPQIGDKTRIWAFAHVLPGAVIGSDCNICDHTFIENDVIIGDRVTIKCGVQIWDGVRLEDDVFVGPNATFTNDRLPRSKQYPPKFATTTVRQGASIGANATILPGLEIGRQAMVGAGTVVTRNVPAHAVVVGNPARIIGYEPAYELARPALPARPPASALDGVRGVRLIELPDVKDLRGDLSVVEFEANLPFTPRRSFWISHVPHKEIRGEHAHRKTHQFIVCLNGSVTVLVDDGHQRAEIQLDRSNLGLYLPPMVWGAQHRYSPDAILLVLASEVYDPQDYIREYDEFIRQVSAG